MESYKHKFAKEVLAKWLSDAEEMAREEGVSSYVNLEPLNWRPNHGVWLEYPICLNENNELIGLNPVWAEIDEFSSHSPTYDEAIVAKLLPIVIFDLVVHHKGDIVYAFEVVHKSDITEIKVEYLKRIVHESHGLEIYRISADWILSRIGPPTRLVCESLYIEPSCPIMINFKKPNDISDPPWLISDILM